MKSEQQSRKNKKCNCAFHSPRNGSTARDFFTNKKQNWISKGDHFWGHYFFDPVRLKKNQAWWRIDYFSLIDYATDVTCIFFFHFILYRFIFSLNFSHKCRNSTKPPLKKKSQQQLWKNQGENVFVRDHLYSLAQFFRPYFIIIFFFYKLGEKSAFIFSFFLVLKFKKKIAGFSYVVLCTGESIYVKPCLIRKKQLTPQAAN